MPKLTNLRISPKSRGSYELPTQNKSTTPAPVKYEILPFDRAKILSGEIDPKLVNPYKYAEFPRNASGQVTIDLNTDIEFNRYMINLQISKFEDAKFNEVIDIEFEEFLPAPVPEAVPTAVSALIDRVSRFNKNIASNISSTGASQKVVIKR